MNTITQWALSMHGRCPHLCDKSGNTPCGLRIFAPSFLTASQLRRRRRCKACRLGIRPIRSR